MTKHDRPKTRTPRPYDRAAERRDWRSQIQDEAA
jgi:hypothetical protein